MKRYFSLILVVFFLAVGSGTLLAQPPGVPAPKVFKWKMQAHWPAASASFKPLKDFLENRLAKLTDGRLLITLHPAGALVPFREIFDACRKGTIEAAVASPAYWMTVVPIAAVAANMPLTFRDASEGLYFHNTLGFEDMLKEAHAKHNLLYYTEKIFPTAMVGKKPIRRLDDFKGYKIRSSGMIADMLKDLGASPTLIPGEELYMALQTGVIDGAHWGAALGALSMKLCEVAKFYVQPDLAMAGTDVIIINRDAFNALPKDLQVILDSALRERLTVRSIEYGFEEMTALNTMKRDFKVTVTTLPPEDQKKMMDVAVKQWDKVAARDAEAARAISMLKEFLKKIGHID